MWLRRRQQVDSFYYTEKVKEKDSDNPSIPDCSPIQIKSFTCTGLLWKMATRGTLAYHARNTFLSRPTWRWP